MALDIKNGPPPDPPDNVAKRSDAGRVDWDSVLAVTGNGSTKDRILLLLADGKYWSSEEIASALGRASQTAREATLELTRQGTLERKALLHPTSRRNMYVFRLARRA